MVGQYAGRAPHRDDVDAAAQTSVQLGRIRIDIETCERCKGQVKIIARIEESAVIERILAHLNGKAPSAGTSMLPAGRAPPPQARLFD